MKQILITSVFACVEKSLLRKFFLSEICNIKRGYLNAVRGRWFTTSLPQTTAVRIQTEPNEVMVDDEFNIKVSGLKPNEQITINARVQEKDKIFTSLGCYRANNLGIVDCSEHPSQAGTYTGIHCMGLIWSMIQAPGYNVRLRLLKSDVCSPQVMKFSVYKNHLQLDDVFSENRTNIAIATSHVKRWYKSEKVKRVDVREGKLRGTLFIPPGKGPFPGILDVFGEEGGLVETRAALLASHGYIVLALAYFNFENLPKDPFSLDLEYFKEAVKYLKSHSQTKGKNMGGIGISKGGEIIQLLAVRCPDLKAITVINGVPYRWLTTYKDDGRLIKPPNTFEPFRIERTEEGMNGRAAFRIDSTDFTPIWNAEANVLSICSSDDQVLPVELHHLQYDKWPVDQRHKLELVRYEGAGHLIEPPYAPLTRASYWKSLGANVVWGGNALDHAFAQEDSWKRILEFFSKNLKYKNKVSI